MIDKKGICAVITGGGSGMGAETARALALEGVNVVLLDVNEQAVQGVANELNGIGFVCDVRDPQQVEAVFEKAHEAYGAPHILINCAGIAPAKRVVGRQGPMPLDDFKNVIDINLIGTFNVIRIAAGYMTTADILTESGERGVIINTASVAAFEGQIGQAAYSASKGGVVGMTLPIARELSQFGIRVVTIAPGIMDTPMMAAMPENVQASLAEQVPFPKRFGKASEYAQLAMHIIENEMINGSVIRLDGGIRMQAK